MRKLSRNKKLLIAGLVVLLVIALGVAAYAFVNRTKPPEMVTVSGKMTCLASSGTGRGAIGLSCALGLAGDDGNNYALNFEKTSMVSPPPGRRITVTGMLTRQPSRFDAVGVILIDRVELEPVNE